MPTRRILLAPGASGSIDSLRAHEAGLTERGLSVGLVELPKGKAERAVDPYRRALEAEGAEPTAVGGHSYGGRVASLLAADAPGVAALVLLSFPLHAPGRREAWDERTAHFGRIGVPTLFLSGESDPFADLALLRQAVERLPRARLVTYPGVGHGLRPVLDDALDAIADFLIGRS